MQAWRVFVELLLVTYVTRFAKKDLPHTSDFQTSMIRNFTCVIAMDLQIVQFKGQLKWKIDLS